MRTPQTISADHTASSDGGSVATVQSATSPRPIDLVHLTRQTFGDKRLETELLRLFLRQAQIVGHALSSEAGAVAPDGQNALSLLHKLSGSARAVGATQVSALAERLERDRRLGSSADPLSPEERRRLDQALTAATTYIGELLDAA